MCEDFEGVNAKCRNVNNDNFYSNFKPMKKKINTERIGCLLIILMTILVWGSVFLIFK